MPTTGIVARETRATWKVLRGLQARASVLPKRIRALRIRESVGHPATPGHAAGLPVEDPREPVVVALFALVRKHPGVLLDAPITASRFTRGWKHDAVPFAVFAASEHLPELLMDARYLAYVEQRFEDYTLWRVNAAVVAVRNEDGRLLGIIEGRVGPLPVLQ